MLGSKHIGTPMDYITKLRIVEKSVLVDKGRYQKTCEKTHLSFSHKTKYCLFSWHD